MTRPLHITYSKQYGYFVVTFFNGKQKNYANLSTLFGFLTDYYARQRRHSI